LTGRNKLGSDCYRVRQVGELGEEGPIVQGARGTCIVSSLDLLGQEEAQAVDFRESLGASPGVDEAGLLEDQRGVDADGPVLEGNVHVLEAQPPAMVEASDDPESGSATADADKLDSNSDRD
jgi:hypothetical protein